MGTSSIDSHREKITGLQWITGNLTVADASLRGSQILSSALDGRIILWDIDLAGPQTLIPKKTFLITAENLPRNIKSKARSKAEVGITCLAVNKEDTDIIMIGNTSSPNTYPQFFNCFVFPSAIFLYGFIIIEELVYGSIWYSNIPFRLSKDSN